MTKHIVVSDFTDWNKWYAEGAVDVATTIKNTDYHENQCVLLTAPNAEQVGIIKDDKIFRLLKYFPCKISPCNTDQAFALHLLKDDGIPLKILSGVAGSGKTLLACAHAIEQLKQGKKSKIVIAKSMTPVGREIGFLKGDMYEKVRPWLGPFYDNFINCGIPPFEIDEMVEDGVIEIVPITFIQGRSFSSTTVIIDEVQNLDMNIIKQIVTRASDNSEIILLGDQTQVFSQTRDRSIDVLIDKGKSSSLVGSVHMDKSLRSPLADWAIKNL